VGRIDILRFEVVAQLVKLKPSLSVPKTRVPQPDACVFEAAGFLYEINFGEFSYRLMIRGISIYDANIENRRIVQ
jgi:hypothetical protein